MSISVFEIFKIGIGPSSSHTVGPMKAAYDFIQQLTTLNQLTQVTRIQIDLYGSLALTGIGHAVDLAILNGLCGEQPETVEPHSILARSEHIKQSHKINLFGTHSIHFDFKTDFIFHLRETLPLHTNGMRFSALMGEPAEKIVLEETYYSIGGGFITTEKTFNQANVSHDEIPYPFESAQTLLRYCQEQQCAIAEIMLRNEEKSLDRPTIKKRILHIANIMRHCIDTGCQTRGFLPGGLNVKRRAADLFEKLSKQGTPSADQQSDMMNWLNLYAMAVNEENAAGGRIVTAPTNGAAGVIPSVLNYYLNYHKGANDEKAIEFLLTAAAIAILYKKGASISGAEVGCQGEVGVASSMAAAALTAVLGGNIAQIENAAEIAMEHHLGMTCDPIGGLVQIPCIERNAMGAVKAVNAARLALMEDGQHMVSLDKVIATMHQTGKDMMTIYKETSLGGLAVNIIEC